MVYRRKGHQVQVVTYPRGWLPWNRTRYNKRGAMKLGRDLRREGYEVRVLDAQGGLLKYWPKRK